MARRSGRNANSNLKRVLLVRMLKLVVAVSLSVFFAMLCVGVKQALFEKNPLLVVRQINSNVELPAGFKGKLYGRKLFALSLPDVYKQLKDLFPYAKKITIWRILPDTLKIIVKERKPVFFVKRFGHIYPIDGEGVVLGKDMKLPRDVMQLKIKDEIRLVPGKICQREEIFLSIRLLNALKEFGLLDVLDIEYIDAMQPYELRAKIRKGPMLRFRGNKYRKQLKLFKERLLDSFLEDLPKLNDSNYLLFLEDGTTITRS